MRKLLQPEGIVRAQAPPRQEVTTANKITSTASTEKLQESNLDNSQTDARLERVIKKVQRINGLPIANDTSDKPEQSAVKRVKVNVESADPSTKKKTRPSKRYQPMYYSHAQQKMVTRFEFWKEWGLARPEDYILQEKYRKEEEEQERREREAEEKAAALQVQLDSKSTEEDKAQLLDEALKAVDNINSPKEDIIFKKHEAVKIADKQDSPFSSKKVSAQPTQLPKDAHLNRASTSTFTFALKSTDSEGELKDSKVSRKDSASMKPSSVPTYKCAPSDQKVPAAEADDNEDTPDQPIKSQSQDNYGTPTKRDLKSENSTALKEKLLSTPSETAESVADAPADETPKEIKNPFLLESEAPRQVMNLASLIQGYNPTFTQKPSDQGSGLFRPAPMNPNFPASSIPSVQLQQYFNRQSQQSGMELEEQPCATWSAPIAHSQSYSFVCPNTNSFNGQFQSNCYFSNTPNLGYLQQQQPVFSSFYTAPQQAPQQPQTFTNFTSQNTFGNVPAVDLFRSVSREPESLFSLGPDNQKNTLRPPKKVELACNKKQRQRIF